METKRVRSKVFRLPTKNASKGCVLIKNDGRSWMSVQYSTQDWLQHIDTKSHHLYVTSDEEIKAGDWMINKNRDTVYQYVGAGNCEYWDKIIASTDPKLIGYIPGNRREAGNGFSSKCFKMAQPSPSFIQKYCELGGIDEVDLEYVDQGHEEFARDIDSKFIWVHDWKLKVDPVHNTITTHAIKDSWSREEVKLLIERYQDKFGAMGSASTFCQDWIKLNL